jgi:hypothetical protein
VIFTVESVVLGLLWHTRLVSTYMAKVNTDLYFTERLWCALLLM